MVARWRSDTQMMLLSILVLLLPIGARADIYTIGCSFTWDGRPSDLDDSPQWHIDCGKPLIYLYDNPSFPCVTSSTLWTTALKSTVFDAISFQPVDGYGSKLWDDVFTIYSWLRTQPTAAIVIHQTWPVPASWEQVYHGPSDPVLTNRSLTYGYQLASQLRVIYPGRPVVLTRSNEMLDQIYHDCLRGRCPFPTGFQEMFRDASGHMSLGPGQYLQHNALRAAFGQPVGVLSPVAQYQITAPVKAYLDDVVNQYMCEPGSAVPLLVGAALLSRSRRVRNTRRAR